MPSNFASSLKSSLCLAAMPLAQRMVRRLPPSRLREQLWRWGKWRSLDFVAKANGVELAGNTLDAIQGYIYWFGCWEPNLTEFIRRRMTTRPDGAFIDVGANIGYFSLLVANQFPNSRVVAIEAFPPTVSKLRGNIELNRLANIRIVEAAVGDQSGTLDLFYGGNSNEGATTSIRGRYESPAVSVRCDTLPALLDRKELSNARIIKIDVEGAEASVVRGLESELAHLPWDAEVVVEVSCQPDGRSAQIFDAFFAKGFNAYELENDYDARAYLGAPSIVPPQRLRSIPAKQTDVVFSRVDGEVL